MCRLGLGLKAPALARLWAAQALSNHEPGQKPEIRLGPARLWLKPGLYTTLNYIFNYYQTFVKVQYKKKPRPGPTARAFQNLRPGQSRLQANTFGPAWPGFFGPGLARLLASGRSRHITNLMDVEFNIVGGDTSGKLHILFGSLYHFDK
ncbi:hypothetical protein BDZ97DRAFT_1768010 [Flammula alnicola]|nr:hypothetical protein BDZ97DRAFT_1768010 [Flammula alnicola]